jgi:tetratricopeptide (TPR) repeat protein
VTDDARKYCELGAEHLDRGEPEEALQWYERAIEEDPENPDAWCGRGKACYDLGRLERADRAFKRALAVASKNLPPVKGHRRWWADPDTRPYLRALHGRGLCRFWLGVYEDAARVFRKLIRLAPSDPLDVRFLVGETYFRMGEVDRAIRELEKAGDDPDALYNLGLAWFYKGDFPRSVNAFRRGMFENIFLAGHLAELDVLPETPRYRGTHPKGLDSDDAAYDYLERCGDLWRGRPLLQRWVRSIYEHPTVQDDLRRHRDHLKALSAEAIEAGERARLEGENTSLRSDGRLASTDRSIAEELVKKLFIVS